MKKTTILFLFTLLCSGAFAQMARVQVIHNAPDTELQQVDVYINNMLLYDNFEYLTATPFISVPAGVPLTVTVTKGDSPESVFTATETLEADATYIMIATGIYNGANYNPAPALSVAIYPMAREYALDPEDTDVLFFHGGTDGPMIDIRDQESGQMIFNDAAYGTFSDYYSIAPENYIVDMTTADNSAVLHSYEANLASLGLQGMAVTVVASGFVNPANNNQGDMLALWATTADGGPLMMLPEAAMGIINNAIQKVSVYPNPAESQITISVPAGYSKIESILYDTAGRKVLTANGPSLDITQLSPGIYNLVTNVDGNTNNLQIVKK